MTEQLVIGLFYTCFLVSSALAQVDGNWGSWTQWSDPECPVTCGGGSVQQVRTRQCDSPAPSAGGSGCTNSSSDIEIRETSCSDDPCPISTSYTGSWGSWGSWSDSGCPVTCGDGSLMQTRTRQCDYIPPYPLIPVRPMCENAGTGAETRVVSCSEDPCPDINLPLNIGISCGAVVVLLVLFAAVCYCKCRRERQGNFKPREEPDNIYTAKDTDGVDDHDYTVLEETSTAIKQEAGQPDDYVNVNFSDTSKTTEAEENLNEQVTTDSGAKPKLKKLEATESNAYVNIDKRDNPDDRGQVAHVNINFEDDLGSTANTTHKKVEDATHDTQTELKQESVYTYPDGDDSEHPKDTDQGLSQDDSYPTDAFEKGHQNTAC